MLSVSDRHNWTSRSNPSPQKVSVDLDEQNDSQNEKDGETSTSRKERRRSISAAPVVTFSTVVTECEDNFETYYVESSISSVVGSDEKIIDDENALDDTRSDDNYSAGSDISSDLEDSNVAESDDQILPLEEATEKKMSQVSKDFQLKLEQELERLQRELQISDSGNETDGQKSSKKSFRTQTSVELENTTSEEEEEFSLDESEDESSVAMSSEEVSNAESEADADEENESEDELPEERVVSTIRNFSQGVPIKPRHKQFEIQRKIRTANPVILETDLEPERTFTEFYDGEPIDDSTSKQKKALAKKNVGQSASSQPTTEFEKYLERSKSDTKILLDKAKPEGKDKRCATTTNAEIINVPSGSFKRPGEEDEDESDNEDGNYQCIKIEVEPASSINDSEDEKSFDLHKMSKNHEEAMEALYEEAFKRQQEENEVSVKAAEKSLGENFSNTLDDMLIQVRAVKEKYKKKADVGSLFSQDSFKMTPTAVSTPNKWQNMTEIASSLAMMLTTLSAEIIAENFTEIVPLVATILDVTRKNKRPEDFQTQIAILSTIRVLSDRVYDIRAAGYEKTLKNADLTWLVRTLCKIYLDEESKTRAEASFCLAALVKSFGAEIICRPIYFILVMENDSKKRKSSNGNGNGGGGGDGGGSSGGSKTKAAALDVLSYTLLTFSNIKNMEEICQWVSLALLHKKRRVRQSAIETAAVILSTFPDPEDGLQRFKHYIAEEELHFIGFKKKEESSEDSDDQQKQGNAEASHLKSLTGSSIKNTKAVEALEARIQRNALPLPSPSGLIEYAMKVPTGKELVLILTRMHDRTEEDFNFSSSSGGSSRGSTASGLNESFESITMSAVMGTSTQKRKTKKQLKQEAVDEMIPADLAYVLGGKGPVFRPQNASSQS